MFVDSHAHLDPDSYPEDSIEKILQRATEAGVENIIHIGSGEGVQSMQGTPELLDRYDQLYGTIGVHPHDAKIVDSSVLDQARHLAGHPKVVAIGEVGLDYHYENSPREAQQEALRSFIQLAKELKKPLSIHNRDSDADLIKILKEEKAEEVGGVIHCFSGDYEMGKTVLGLNFLVSFTGIVTFKKAQTIQDAAKRLPLEKMMIETDSPYLAPIPFRGKKNEPAWVTYVAAKIAELKNLAIEDVARLTTLNAHRLFGFGAQRPEASIAYQIRDSLYLNITNRCTLACVFCPKFVDWEVKGHYLRLKSEPGFEEVIDSLGDIDKFKEVVFCGYGEPTQKLDLLKKVAGYLKEKDKKVRLDTDGLGNLIHERNILPDLAGLVDAVNVSLNAADAKTYAKLCPNRFGEAAYPEVKKFILEAKKHLPWVQASVVGMPGVNIEACRKVAEEELGVNFRHREYNNVG